MPLSHSVRQILLVSLLFCLCIVTAGAKEPPKGIESKVLDKVPAMSETLGGYDSPDRVIDRLSEMPLHAVEGMWRFAAEGTLMAIERCDDRRIGPEDAGTVTYRMIVVRAVGLTLGRAQSWAISPRLRNAESTTHGYIPAGPTRERSSTLRRNSPSPSVTPTAASQSAATAARCASTGGVCSPICIATSSAARRKARET